MPRSADDSAEEALDRPLPKPAAAGSEKGGRRLQAPDLTRLHLRVDAEEISLPEGRVVVFHIPARPLGVPISVDGAYWMRAGESVAPMTVGQISKILSEVSPDYSSAVCQAAHAEDLAPTCVEEFRRRWARKSGNAEIAKLSAAHLLADAGLFLDGGVTFAALILLGSPQALARHLPQAELVFEVRSNDASIECQRRLELRSGFLGFHDSLWREVNARNDMQHLRDGLFVWDIPTFNEEAVREAILNAVSHRDYRLPGSVFVRQYPTRLEVVSPGGFPPGVTPRNLLWRQVPRNRLLAEALGRCGLVERSGQGIDKMYRTAIREAKPLPAFGDSDEHQVSVVLRGEIRDPSFLRFLEKVGAEKLTSFSVKDLLVLDEVSRGEPVPDELRDRVPGLMEQGILEAIGHGRGRRHVLSRRYYEMIDRRGSFTRRRGLEREKFKALILEHLKHFGQGTMRDFQDGLKELSEKQIRGLLGELRDEGKVVALGAKRGSYWALAVEPASTVDEGHKTEREGHKTEGT